MNGVKEMLPELIPVGYEEECSLLKTPWAYDHIRWMVQKDFLRQDIFLVGAHSPMRRWLAFRFCDEHPQDHAPLPNRHSTARSTRRPACRPTYVPTPT